MIQTPGQSNVSVEQTPEEAQAAAAKLASEQAEIRAKREKEEEEKKKQEAAYPVIDYKGKVPTLKEVIAAGYSKEVAKKIVAEEQAKFDAAKKAKAETKGLLPGQHYGYKDKTGRPYHERRGDIYFHPFEVKDPMFDDDAKRVPARVWDAMVKEGKVEVIVMANSRGGVAFGISKTAPAPTAQPPKPEKTKGGKETSKDEKDETEEDSVVGTVPKGFERKTLNEEQKKTVADPKFASLAEEDQIMILDQLSTHEPEKEAIADENF